MGPENQLGKNWVKIAEVPDIALRRELSFTTNPARLQELVVMEPDRDDYNCDLDSCFTNGEDIPPIRFQSLSDMGVRCVIEEEGPQETAHIENARNFPGLLACNRFGVPTIAEFTFPDDPVPESLQEKLRGRRVVPGMMIEIDSGFWATVVELSVNQSLPAAGSIIPDDAHITDLYLAPAACFDFATLVKE